MAFFWFLALFPIIIAALSIYGLIADPAQIQQQISSFASALPESVQQLLNDQLRRLTEQTGTTLGLGTGLGIAGAIWSSSKGVKAMMTALNICYNEEEERGFFKVIAVALALTVVLLLTSVLSVAAIVALPIILDNAGLHFVVEGLITWLRWPLLMLLMIAILSILYRWAPCRADARLSWVTTGAIAASCLWIIGSWLFSFFVTNFGSYSNTYGTLAAVIILMLWMHMSAFIALLGAEINSETERQTSRDTTTGDPMPIGQREAYSADTVGPRQD